MLTSAPRSPIRTSTMRPWPKASACILRGRSPTRRIWEPRLSARSPSSPTLAKEFDMEKLYRGLVLVLGVLLCGGGNFAWAQTAPAGDAANGKRVYLAVGC